MVSTVGKDRVCVGTRALLSELGVRVPASAVAEAEALEAAGVTTVFGAVGDAKAAQVLIGVADEIKEDAEEAVRTLQDAGVDVWVCSGDNDRTVRAVAASVGIPGDRVVAGLSPEGKADHVHRLQREGGGRGRRVVAMVGDGVNDAPALARADLGIALGTGTDIAVEAAGMVLMRDALMDVPLALHISRATFRRIRLNLAWALAFNIIGARAGG